MNKKTGIFDEDYYIFFEENHMSIDKKKYFI